MNALAAIHVARKQLGLDEDTYRAMLRRLTGKESAAALTERERQAVVEELRRRGFKSVSKGTRKRLEGPFAKKFQALWIAGWNLGVVDDRRDEAMAAFVKRQTGIDQLRWVRDAEDAARAIEALKAWLARPVEKGGAGVDWSVSRWRPDWMQRDGYRIAMAQFGILARLDPSLGELTPWVVRMIDPHFDPASASDRVWIEIMNALGDLVRRSKR